MDEKKRNTRKKLEGVVSSDKMDKTIAVKITNLVKHPRYKKYVKRVNVLKAHDENNEAKIGDRVEIMECRRLSKSKTWRLLQVLEQAPRR